MSKFLHAHAKCIGKGYFHGTLYKVSWFPGAIANKNSFEKVYGSLFKVNDFDSVFKVLDDYEGVGENYPEPNLFKKELVTAYLDDSTVETWVYLFNLSVDNLVQIDSGDFLKFSNDQ